MRHVVLLILLVLYADCQIRRNIAYTFLELDKNGDFLLNSQELFPNQKQFNQEDMQIKYSWTAFQAVFPILKHLQWDKDKDNELSEAQFRQMIEEDFIKKQNIMEGFKSFKQLFPQDQLFNMCKENGKVTPNSFAICLGVWIGFERDLYEYRLPSIYKLDSSAQSKVSYPEFRKMVIKTDEQLPEKEQQKIKKMFSLFEISNDEDDVLDNNQMKIVEAVLLMPILDQNKDKRLSKSEAKFIFSEDYGGDKVFKFADLNKDNKISKNQFIAHFIFALDLDSITNKDKPQVQQQKIDESDL